MAAKPDKATPKAKRKPRAKRKPKPEKAAPPVVDELDNINSLEDVKELFNDGVDKLRKSSVEDLKRSALRAGNRLFKAWKKLVDGD